AVGSISGVLELSGGRRVERPAGSVRACREDGEDRWSAAAGRNLPVGRLHWHLQVDAVVHVVPKLQGEVPHQFAADAEAGLEAVSVPVVGGDAVANRGARRRNIDSHRRVVSRSEMSERQFALGDAQTPELGHSWIGRAQRHEYLIDVASGAV